MAYCSLFGNIVEQVQACACIFFKDLTYIFKMRPKCKLLSNIRTFYLKTNL
jgi:hypothetical protein